MNKCKLYVARAYMTNVLLAAQANRSVRSELVEWTEREESFLKILGVQCVLRDGFKNKSVIHNIKRAINALERKTRRPPALDADANATRLVVRRFSLGPAATALLELAHGYIHCSLTNEIWDKLKQSALKPLDALAVLLRLPRLKIEKGFRELARSGISDWKVATRGHTYFDPDDFILDWFLDVWHPPVRDMRELTARLVGSPCNARLSPGDFEHIAEREDVQRALHAAKRKRSEGEPASGLNILLYGRPGTGKTEFAKTLAETAGIALFEVEESGIGDDEPCESEHDRKANYRNKLRMAQTLLQSMPDAAILCDEAEDALESSSGTRLANHRLLEANPVPVIYTMNSLKDLDESMMRRFTLVLRFTAHGPTRQTGVLHRMLAESGLEGIDASACAKRLVDELECAPGILSKAIETTCLVGGSEADVYRYCEQLERAITTRYARPRLGPPVRAKLPWEAFSHLERDAETVGHGLAPGSHGRR